MRIRDTIKRFFESMLARWAPQAHDEVADRAAMRLQTRSHMPILIHEEEGITEKPVPAGMYPVRKSTSLPDLLRRIRKKKTIASMPTTLENLSIDAMVEARLVVTVRCMLTTAEQDPGVKVTVQCLKDATSTYIKIFKHHECILHLDRKLLRFVENADRMTLAFNARSHEYDWWVLGFERRHMHDYHSLHYHILQDASI